MPARKPPTVPLPPVSVPATLAVRLAEVADQIGFTRSALIRQAVREFVEARS